MEHNHKLSPNSDRKIHRKLPQVDGIERSEASYGHGPVSESRASPEKMKKQPNMNEDDRYSPDGASIAYISETLITQITKEQRLDMIKSLTIHLPKDKLNKKIKYIENLEKLRRLQSLNLSNNMVEKMQKLESLVELRELNLANNCIKVIECVGNLAKLQTLNLSGNQITAIPGPTMKKLRCLKNLKLSHNKLETLLDITKLRCLQDLTNLDLQGNPFSTLPHYRQFVIFQLRSLDVLDNQAVTKDERLQADQRFAQEEVRRLEVELNKQEKLYVKVEGEKNEAQKMVEHLTKTQNSLKAKDARQVDIIKELEHDIEAKNGLLKAKNSDLVRASENQYRLEQELAFYKLDAKFEMLGELPLLNEETQIEDEEYGLNDSAYIGKATFKRNAFTREHYIADGAQMAQMKSLRNEYEEDLKKKDILDQELLEKRAAIIRLQEQLERLADDVDEKDEQLRNASKKLASLEQAMVHQMDTFGQGNEMAKKQLAEKIEFIKRLQAAAEELEERMKNVADDVARKQKELEELRSREGDGDIDGQSGLLQGRNLKQAELEKACAELSKMKDDLAMLQHRIAEEQAEVETLRKQLGKEAGVSEEIIEQLKKELESVIGELNDRQEEQEELAREQQERIEDLEHERDVLRGKIASEKEIEDNMNDLQDELKDAVDALENERKKCHELGKREKELRDQFSAYDKNNKLGLIEAQGKLKHLGKENEKLQDIVKQLRNQIENERESAKARVHRDQERIAKALEAARLAGDKDKDIEGLALQLDALKATNEALNDRLEDAENELSRKEKDAVDKDVLLQKLNDLLKEFKKGGKNIREPVDETDGIGRCLADLHQEYLNLGGKLEDEKEKGKMKEKQAKEVIDNLESQLAQVTSQLNAAENGLAQLSREGTIHDADLKNLEDDIYRLQENLKAALDKAEGEENKRARDKKAYEDKIRDLKDEIKRLQAEKQNSRNQRDKDLDQMRALVKRKKDRFDNEIRQLQDEIKQLQDRHTNDLLMKDKEIAELETQLSEDEQLFMEDKNKKKDDIGRELKELRRLVADRTRSTEEAINNDMERKRAQRELENTRRKLDDDVTTAQDNINHLEKLLEAKEKQIRALRKRGLELEHNVAALTEQLEDLKRTLSNRERYLPKPTTTRRIRERREEEDTVAPTVTRHNVHPHSTPVNHDIYQSIHHHHYDNNAPLPSLIRSQDVPQTPLADISAQVHHYHYDNGNPLPTQTRSHNVSQVPVAEISPPIHHYHYDNDNALHTLTKGHAVSQAPVADVTPVPVDPEVHYHHHYGNGDFTEDLKRKKSKKKDFCNISEHDDLRIQLILTKSNNKNLMVDDVMDLEEELAITNRQLSSQMTENKLNELRSDLKDLEHTVIESSRRKSKSSEPLDSQLAETIAKFQDHLLTIMDHRATLSSEKT